MKRKKNIVIAVFVLINLFLLYNLYLCKNQFVKINSEVRETVMKFYDERGVNYPLNSTSHLYRPIYLDSLYFETNKALTLCAFFSNNSCPSCAYETVTVLNDFYENKKGLLKVFYIGKRDEFVNDYNCRFPVTSISEFNSVISSNFEVTFPSIFLVDKNNLIHSIYRAELQNRSKLNTFFKKVNYLISMLERETKF